MMKYVNITAVVVLLVGFPLSSYFYMKHGFEYRKTAIEAQGDFGTMPDLNALTEWEGDLPDNPRGSMVVVGWLDQQHQEAADVYGDMLDSLHTQFEDSPHLYFTTIAKADSAYLNAWKRKHDLPAVGMMSVLTADQTEFRNSARDFQLPVEPGLEPIVALVDSSMTIRKYYNLAERDETIGLVQLISLIIPLPEKADIILDPKKEL